MDFQECDSCAAKLGSPYLCGGCLHNRHEMSLYEMWTPEDLEDLDAKFDALIEYLGIEFVFERVSDGSDTADSKRCYARKKKKP